MQEKKKVKDTKKTPVTKDEDFADDEDNKRLIIFIAVALLVIIGTIIGLLVGCEKEDKKGEDEKGPKEDIVVPIENEIDDEEDDYFVAVEPVKVVQKVTKVTKITNNNDKKSSNDNTSEDDEEEFEVVFYYNDNEDSYVTNVTDGDTVDEYLPKGYDSCDYYTDSEYATEYDFSTKISSSKNIYMVCQATVYTINYDQESDNSTTYSVDEGTVELSDPTNSELIFDGWYTDSDFSNKVTELSKDIIDYANSDNVINLYAKFVENYKVTYYNGSTTVATDELTKSELSGYEIYDGSNLTDDSGDKFLGWATSSGSKSIAYNSGDVIDVSSDISLYAVFGAAKVAYVNDDKVVEEVAYTKEEMDEFDLPTADDLGMDVPTYYVPVLEDTDTSKNVVDDEATEVKDNEVKIGTVKEKAAEGYEPNVGDKVEEKEKELKWTTDKKEIDPATSEEKTITVEDQVEVKEIVVDNVEKEEDTTLEAEWVEQEEETEEPETELN